MDNGADEPADSEGIGLPGRVAQVSLTPVRLAFALVWISLAEVRTGTLGENLSTDAVWNILLDLFVQRCRSRRVSVGDLCGASGVPESTALRWIKLLQERGLIQRTPDAEDGRRAYVTLTGQGLKKMEDALDAGAASYYRVDIMQPRNT